MAGAAGGPGSGGQARQWDVALSFAGAQREFVEQVAVVLAARGVLCFYDLDPQTEAELWGKHLAEHLPSVYGNQAALVVVFVSAEYVQREWTQLEHRAARSRAMQENREYLLPVRFDDTELPGLSPDVAVINLQTRPRSPEEIAGLIILKLDRLGITKPALTAGPVAPTAVFPGRPSVPEDGGSSGGPVAVDAEPVRQHASWRQAIAPDRKPEVQGFVSPSTTRPAGAIALVPLAVWTVLAAGLALTQQPTWWLTAGAASGFAALCIGRSVAINRLGYAWWDAFLGEDRLTSAVFTLIFATLFIYISTAISFTNSGLAESWVIAVLVLFVIAAGALIFAGTIHWDARQDRALLGRQKDVAATVEASRWMRDPPASQRSSGLLEPLVAIPATRFAHVPKGKFSFVAVSGSRVALVAFANWPSGTYTGDPGASADIRRDGKYSKKVTDEVRYVINQAENWLQQIPQATFHIIIVARSSASSRARSIRFEIDESYGVKDRLAIAFANRKMANAGWLRAFLAVLCGAGIGGVLVRRQVPG